MDPKWFELFQNNRAAFYERIALLNSAERDELIAELVLELNTDWLRKHGLDGVPVAVAAENNVEGADTRPVRISPPPLARRPAESIADLASPAQLERATDPRPALTLIPGGGKTTPRRRRVRVVTRIVPEVG